MAESSWREQDAQEANAGGRKPTGHHNDRGRSSKWLLLGNWPDTGPRVPGLERGADMGRWAVKECGTYPPVSEGKLDTSW